MGMMKAIQAKREELEKNRDAFRVFLRSAVEIHDQVQKIAASVDQMDTLRKQIGGRVNSLDTRGVKELEAYKKSLESVSVGSSREIAELSKLFTRPLPLAPVQSLVNRQQVEIDGLMREWVTKHAAAFPKDIKQGMAFKGPKGEIIEISQIGNHAYGVKQLKDGKQSDAVVTKAVLCVQGGYRYLNG